MTNEPAVNIINQYLKSLHLDNFLFPNQATLSSTQRPAINVDLSANAKAVNEDNMFEVQISGTVSAMYSDNKEKLFDLSFCYGAIFKMVNVPEAEKEVLLLVYCPSILFPFVRRIVSDVTSDAGFPPIMIDMIDFGKLYQQNLEKRNLN
jgi:preprotein translocase subunit SecB